MTRPGVVLDAGGDELIGDDSWSVFVEDGDDTAVAGLRPQRGRNGRINHANERIIVEQIREARDSDRRRRLIDRICLR